MKPESYQKLLFKLPKDLRLLFVVAYHVGLRKGAPLRIKWSQVGLKGETIWIMKITGHRTRNVFERYNITDHTDTLDAGRKAEEFLSKGQREVAQIKV